MSRRRHREAASKEQPSKGVIIPFPVHLVMQRTFSHRDHFALRQWVTGAAAREAGIGDIVVESWQTDDAPPVLCDNAMVYLQGDEWSTWSLTRSVRRYSVWKTAMGGTLGIFETIEEALDFVTACASSRKTSVTSERHNRRRANGT